MSYEYLELVDPETGEFYEVQRKYCAARGIDKQEKSPLPPYNLSNIECKEFFYDRLKPYHKDVAGMSLKIDKEVLSILSSKELSVGALSLLAYLAREIYYRNYVYFVMEEFLEDMEVSEKTANRYLSELFSRSYVKEVPCEVPMKEMVLMVNPNLFFQGREQMRLDSVRKWIVC